MREPEKIPQLMWTDMVFYMMSTLREYINLRNLYIKRQFLEVLSQEEISLLNDACNDSKPAHVLWPADLLVFP
jgi:hypothetical protein